MTRAPRRLDFRWMSGSDRTWARAGVVGAGVAAVGLIAAGVGEPQTVLTADGIQPAAPDWMFLLVYLGLGLASVVLLRSEHMASTARIAIGVLLLVMSVGQLEGGLESIAAVYGDLGWQLTLARVIGWLAIASATALFVLGGPTVARARELVAVAGFALLTVAHFLALAAISSAPGLARAELTGGLSWITSHLSWWLLLFAAWQLVAGIHLSIDAARGALRKVATTWLPWFLGLKLIAVAIGILVLSPATFADWERARVAAPLGWAYALVLALAAITFLKAPIAAFDRRATFRTAFVVIALWEAPFVLAFATIALAFLARVVVPSSPADLVAFALVGSVVIALWASTRGHRSARWLFPTAGASAIGVAVVTGRPGTWDGGAERWIAAVAGDVVTFLIDLATPWQAWTLFLVPFAALGWLLIGRRGNTIAATLFLVGLWILPRATSVLLAEVFMVETALIAPNLVMLDIALTAVATGAVVLERRALGRFGPMTRAAGLVVLIVTVAAHGSVAAGVLFEWIAESAAAMLDVDAVALAYVVALVLPAVYAAALDSRHLNERRSESVTFARVAAVMVLFLVGLVVVALGGDTLTAQRDELFRVLVLPGLLLAASMAVAVAAGEDPTA